MPEFNTSEKGVLGEGWEKEWARSKQKGCSLKRKCCLAMENLLHSYEKIVPINGKKC